MEISECTHKFQLLAVHKFYKRTSHNFRYDLGASAGQVHHILGVRYVRDQIWLHKWRIRRLCNCLDAWENDAM